MAKLGDIVVFIPHDEHPQFAGFDRLAAIVGQVHDDDDNSLDLFVLCPNKEAVWMDKVPQHDGILSHFTWLHREQVQLQPETVSTADATPLLSNAGLAAAAAASAGAGGWPAASAVAAAAEAPTPADPRFAPNNPPESLTTAGAAADAAPAPAFEAPPSTATPAPVSSLAGA